MHDESQLLAGVIHHPRLVLVRGEGSYVWDDAGERYLDYTSGLAVSALGHGRTDLADVLRAQFVTLGACSNLYGNLPALDLARRLLQSSFAARVWYANSGTEANEAALKFARLAARATGDARRSAFVAFRGGFHGRTFGALAVTHEPHYRRPFAPLVPGVRFARFNDLDSARRAMGADVCAVIVEPVQGEGGVVPAEAPFLHGLRELCDAHGALLVFDEVQCGLGRLGSLYAYQDYGVVPDMLTLAKPLGGGLPLGAVLLGERAAAPLRPGQHGSTFSGGPAACALGVRVFDAVSGREFLAHVRERAGELALGLAALAAGSPLVAAARGRGLLQALVLRPRHRARAKDVVASARAHGLLVTRAGQDAVRLLPPLTTTAAEVQEALGRLGLALDDVAPRRRAQAAARLQASPSPAAAAPATRSASFAPRLPAAPTGGRS